MYTHRKFDSQNGPFEPESSFTGIKFPMCIHSPSTMPLEIWFPESFFLAQKGCFGNQISYVYTFSFYYTSWYLIPVKLLSGSKAPFWESNFLCVYNCLVPYLLKFDSRKAAFWLKRAVLGIKFPMYSYILLLPCLFKFDSRKASFWLKRAVLEIKFPMCIHSTIPLEIWFPCIHSPSTIPLEIWFP